VGELAESDEAMTTCPFCSAEIDDGLSRFGGNCPHCFNVIPGEEALTDPGVTVVPRPAQPESEGGKKMLLVFAFLAIVAVGAAIGLAGSGEEEGVDPETQDAKLAAKARVLEATRLEAVEEEEATAKELAAAEKQAAEKQAVLAQANTLAITRAKQEATSVETVGAGAETSGPVSTNIRDYTVPLSTGPSREELGEIILQTPAQINAAVRRNLRKYKGQLQQCYNIQLNVDENLKGRWQVGFTVGTDGSTSGVSVKAMTMTMSQADLEACMTRQVESWTFPKINQAYPYVKEYSFGR
jgi:hypothetical protein